jgi:hypothetical protein
LISDPPGVFDAGLSVFGWLDQAFDLIRQISTLGRS